MIITSCLFCNRDEKNYKPDKSTYFICSKCVQLLYSTDQESLSRAYEKAIEKGYSNKARAIESFLMPEETNVRKTKKSKRGSIRRTSLRMARPSRDKVRSQPTVV
jgi:hypothetical protein